jgi:hypothetical protein
MYDDVVSAFPFPVFDQLKLLRALFSVPILILLYAFDCQNEAEVGEKRFR